MLPFVLLLLVPMAICLVFGEFDADQRVGTTGHHPRTKLNLESSMSCQSGELVDQPVGEKSEAARQTHGLSPQTTIRLIVESGSLPPDSSPVPAGSLVIEDAAGRVLSADAVLQLLIAAAGKDKDTPATGDMAN